jgi:hypothetical protein
LEKVEKESYQEPIITTVGLLQEITHKSAVVKEAKEKLEKDVYDNAKHAKEKLEKDVKDTVKSAKDKLDKDVPDNAKRAKDKIEKDFFG